MNLGEERTAEMTMLAMISEALRESRGSQGNRPFPASQRWERIAYHDAKFVGVRPRISCIDAAVLRRCLGRERNVITLVKWWLMYVWAHLEKANRGFCCTLNARPFWAQRYLGPIAIQQRKKL